MPIQILMPALSPTMTEGNLVKWHKKEGDSVEIGDILAEIETDKATMEVESVEEGTIGKIFVQEGTEDVSVNTLIAALLEEGEDASALEGMGSKPMETSASSPKTSSEEQEKKIPAPTPAADEKREDPKDAKQTGSSPKSSKDDSGDRIFATPVAKRIAADKGINLGDIQGSGPHGRIVKADVESASPQSTMSTAENTSSSKRPAIEGTPMDSDGMFPSYQMVKTTNMRKVIAKRLTEAKQSVPHFYLTVDCQIDALLKARTQMNDGVEKHDKISVNDFVIKALACAMADVPEANASWADDHVKIYDQVDVSVAVAIEGGLVTPIIKAANDKSLGTISAEMKSLAQKARDGKLKPEEFQGGTVSISNLGMYGIKEFSAVINPPQGCILAVGAGTKQAIVSKSGDLKAATVMSCTLSVDHRVVDGAVGAEFLKAFKTYIENPILMLK